MFTFYPLGCKTPYLDIWCELHGKNGSKPPCIACCAKWTCGLGVDLVDVAVVGFVCVLTRAWEFWPKAAANAAAADIDEVDVVWPLAACEDGCSGEASLDVAVDVDCGGAEVVVMFWLMIWPAIRIIDWRNSGVGPFMALLRTGKVIHFLNCINKINVNKENLMWRINDIWTLQL